MLRIWPVLTGFFLGLSTIFPVVAANARDVTVYAAASLKTALEDVVGAFTVAHGANVTLSFAGSSALARQIMQGAPADLFISANSDWMDAVEAEGLIEDGSRHDLLGNALVLIGAEDGPEVALADDLAEALGADRLAMALVDAVPAGIYGKAALEALGQWEALAPKVAQSDNVRGALALVASGAAPLGIVYRTDAMAEARVRVLDTFAPDSHPPITYPVALIQGHESPAAAVFLDYLGGAEARGIFERHGFAVLTE